MKCRVKLYSLVLSVVLGLVRAETANATDAGSYSAGGIAITIPPPSAEFVEVAAERRDSMSIMVPGANHRHGAA